MLDLQDRLRPLKAQIFPQVMLLELNDTSLRGQLMRRRGPEPLSLDVPLPPLTCRGGMPLEKEPLADLIGDLMVRDGLIDAIVLAALPAAAVHWRVIEWPFDTFPSDPEDALRQVNPPLNLPLPLEAMVLDLQPLPGVGPPQMLMAASPRDLVNGWIEVFSLGGVRLERLAPAQSCQLTALQPLLAEIPASELVVLLDPTPAGLRLVLVRQGLPVFERLLPQAPSDPWAELQRCLAFYRRQDPGVGGLRLLLAGELPGWEQLEEVLGVRAEQLNPEPFGSLVLQGLAHPEVG
jgi:Tfp pilus assembly PilM family ATPase